MKNKYDYVLKWKNKPEEPNKLFKCDTCGNKVKKEKMAQNHLCQKCKNAYSRKWHKTKNGIISRLFNAQVNVSKRRGHNPPKYTFEEFKNRALNSPEFNDLYSGWKKSGFERGLKPSFDRIDESIGYSFENCQWMTWRENFEKSVEDSRKVKTVRKHNFF